MKSTTELISMLDREESELVSWLDCDEWNAYCDALGGAGSVRPRIGVGIVVESQKGGSIVWGYNKDRRAVLDSLVREGGNPLGMIQVFPNNGKIAIGSTLFSEHEGDPSAQSLLEGICHAFGNGHLEHMLQMGYGPKVRYFTKNQPGQWENAENAIRNREV
jgi:hypothetical protein